MEKSQLQRHRLIKEITAQPMGEMGDAVIPLWEQMAIQIISIVGEAGFDALYDRSLFLARQAFPSLAAQPLLRAPERRLAKLKGTLEAQPPEIASAASSLLLMTFTDILASLVGEELTTRIFTSAWGNNAQASANQEFKDD